MQHSNWSSALLVERPHLWRACPRETCIAFRKIDIAYPPMQAIAGVKALLLRPRTISHHSQLQQKRSRRQAATDRKAYETAKVAMTRDIILQCRRRWVSHQRWAPILRRACTHIIRVPIGTAMQQVIAWQPLKMGHRMPALQWCHARTEQFLCATSGSTLSKCKRTGGYDAYKAYVSRDVSCHRLPKVLKADEVQPYGAGGAQRLPNCV